jgi:hypothetical protein
MNEMCSCTLFCPPSERTLITIICKRRKEVDVRPVLVSELVEASKDGTLKVFGAGTAAVVNPLVSPIKMCITNYQKSKFLCGTTKR